MLIYRIKDSHCPLSQGKYWNESKSTTETWRLPGSLYSAYSCIHTYIHTQMHTLPCEATEAFSRCGVFASRSKALRFQRVRTERGWWWKRKDRRLKCRFRATLEPRKYLSPLTRVTPTFLLLFPLSLLHPYYYDSPFLRSRPLASTVSRPLPVSFMPLAVALSLIPSDLLSA